MFLYPTNRKEGRRCGIEGGEGDTMIPYVRNDERSCSVGPAAARNIRQKPICNRTQKERQCGTGNCTQKVRCTNKC